MPNLRVRRGRLTRWSASVTLALLVLLLTGRSGQHFISPGPVSAPHGSIESECSSCHGAEADRPVHWLTGAFSTDSRDSDSQRCMGCHARGASSILPHSVPEEHLVERTAASSSAATKTGAPRLRAPARMGSGPPSNEDGGIECAICHREHRGREHDLTELDNTRCQACHFTSFESLSDGHPRFLEYPYARRTRIKFDHVTHKVKHFPAENERDFSCVTCHRLEASGRNMEVAGFETSCGDCHEQDVRAEALNKGKRGLSVLDLPSLDLAALTAPEILPIGAWPASKRDQPGAIADWLLTADPTLAPEDLAVVSELDLEDLADASTAERNAVVRYAWALKSLLHELGQKGHGAIVERLERSAGRKLAAGEVTDLLGQIGRAPIIEAERRWFPQLKEELELYRQFDTGGEDLGVPDRDRIDTLRAALLEIGAANVDGEPGPSDRRREEWVDQGGWFQLRDHYSIRYRPQGHEDPFLRAWLDLSSALSGETNGGTASAESEAIQSSAAARVFRLLTKENAPGRCAKCHSVDYATELAGAGVSAGLSINWQPFRRPPYDHSPTRFVHRPHLSLENDDRCLMCHALTQQEFKAARDEFDSNYVGRDPVHGFVADFEPLTSGECASCHRREAVGDACTSCHNYHWGDFAPVYLSEPAPPAQTVSRIK